MVEACPKNRYFSRRSSGRSSGCEAPPPDTPWRPNLHSRSSPNARDVVQPSRICATAGYFRPVLTQRLAYPSQEQANYAFERFSMAVEYAASNSLVVRSAEPPFSDRRAVRIRLFACRLARSTTRRKDRGSARPFVHCATDFLDAQDRRLSENR